MSDTNTYRHVTSEDYESETEQKVHAVETRDSRGSWRTPSKVISAPDTDILTDYAVRVNYPAGVWTIPEGNKGDSGLKMRLGFNSSLTDLTGNGRNASLGGGTTKYVDGQLGGAIYGNGLTYYTVADHASIQLANIRSMYCWIKVSSIALDGSSNRTIYAKADDASNGYRLTIDNPTGALVILIKNADVVSVLGMDEALTLDEWHLAGWEWAGSDYPILYVDNVGYAANFGSNPLGGGNYFNGDGDYDAGDGNYEVEGAQNTFSDPNVLPSPAALEIMRVTTDAGRLLGMVDDLRVYDRQLGAIERANLYYNGLSKVGSVKTRPLASILGQAT